MSRNIQVVEIVELEKKVFVANVPKKIWYWRFIRAWTDMQKIYVNRNARFIFPWSREDLILHEIGHLLGYKHRWMGVMAWHGLFRL